MIELKIGDKVRWPDSTLGLFYEITSLDPFTVKWGESEFKYYHPLAHFEGILEKENNLEYLEMFL